MINKTNLYIQIKYANIVSASLDKFKIKKNSPYLANFRCPLCGDSKKNKIKSRGYIYEDKDILKYKCHNCSASHSFDYFLKLFNYTIFNQMKYEIFQQNASDVSSQKEDKIENPHFNLEKTEIPNSENVLKTLQKISTLDDDHPAKMYLTKDRKIPIQHLHLFYFTENFMKFANSIYENKFSNISSDDPRIVVPFYDENFKLIGFQGRSINPSLFRYINITLDKSKSLIFGLDRVDLSQEFYIFEGAFDSLFIPNAIAMNTASIDAPEIFKLHNKVIVLDNEPRNKELLKIYDNYISKGYKIVIWPPYIEQKDINLMILAGWSEPELLEIIKNHTYSNLLAKYHFNQWKKI